MLFRSKHLDGGGYDRLTSGLARDAQIAALAAGDDSRICGFVKSDDDLISLGEEVKLHCALVGSNRQVSGETSFSQVGGREPSLCCREGIVKRVVVILRCFTKGDTGEGLRSTFPTLAASPVFEASHCCLRGVDSDSGNDGHEEGDDFHFDWLFSKTKELSDSG